MKKVLVVDDEPDAGETVALLLEALGHEAIVAQDGQEAPQLAETFQPRVVLSDLNMPLMDRFDLARRLRRMTFSQRPFLVALSSMVCINVQERTQAAGFDAYIPKPADTNILMALIHDFSQRKDSE